MLSIYLMQIKRLKKLTKLIKNKNIIFNNIAFEKKKKQIFNLNTFFQCSGSSLSSIYMNDKKWVNSRYNFINFFP